MQHSQPQRTKCEIWTRVMGYHRPVSQFNKGKKSEFYSRVYYREGAKNSFVEKYSPASLTATLCKK